MDVTRSEAAVMVDPPMTERQIGTLITIAAIPPAGRRRRDSVGHPWSLYDAATIRQAHAQEAARTAKQFTDNDWIASALLDRQLIRADTETGELYCPDGSRAERMSPKIYGYVQVGPQRVQAHRVIWIAAEGEIPPAMQVNHRNRLRWDNRRANLELVSIGNNIRHAAGKPYLPYHQAVTQLAMLPQPLPETPCTDNMTRAGGVFQL
jgi:hypothetical protein